ILLPEPIQRLIDALSRLPGVGPKTASRLTFHLLRTDGGLAEELSAALAQLRAGTATCAECFNITTAGRELCLVCANTERDRSLICVVEEPLDVLALEGTEIGTATCAECFNITTAGRELCLVCANTERDRSLICVVEEPLDVLALEGTGGYKGLYHVLGGALSPIEGIGPDDLKIAELVARGKAGGVQEVIVATNPSMEGDATAMYLQQQLAPLGSQLTRLARGLPMGGDLEYADQNTLLRALAGRPRLGRK